MTQPVRPPMIAAGSERFAGLEAIERRALWLATWMVHHANHVRESRDGLKVGGHQASSASAVTILTALYGAALRPEDRIAVKPHAAPVLHALAYMAGSQSREALVNFRGLGGAQSYPSRTKDTAPVDFSTGSVGLGVGTTLFASLVQDYLQAHGLLSGKAGRMVAVLGDAELDEGNVFEALLEGWKHDIRNLWWVIDYNRQSLDGVITDRLFQKIQGFFSTVGWKVVILRFGKLLQHHIAKPGGEAIKGWIESCPNDLYSALTFEGGAGFRRELEASLAGNKAIRALLDSHDDAALHRVMTNLGGHDMATLVEAFEEASLSEQPTCFVAYTIKGRGLPFAGHKDNHAGLMTAAQVEAFRTAEGIADGEEWTPYAALDSGMAERAKEILRRSPLGRSMRPLAEAPIPAKPLVPPAGERLSTQEAFGKLMAEIARGGGPLADRIVTTSPDVTVSTNLGPWVNQRGVFDREVHGDVFGERRLMSAQKWARTPTGQHIELGIAENNFFLLLAAAGLANPLFGSRLIPVGAVYDPFVARGLDALNYACYQDARFILVGTPSGLTLAPEGGAHQSIVGPLIGIGQPGLTLFEPSYGDELAAILDHAFEHLQAYEGGSVYLRLSTRQIEQPKRTLPRAAVIDGGYWLREPAPGSDVAVVVSGALAPEGISAVARLGERHPGVGLLVATSADRLHAAWLRSPGGSHVDALLAPLARDAVLVTAVDGHPATLSWLGAVRGQRIAPLGVSGFGQSGDLPDLYAKYRLDADAMEAAAEAALRRRMA